MAVRRGRSAAVPAGGVRRAAGGAVAAAALLAAVGCASPQAFVRTVDDGHAAVTRGICDVVDAADRAFGEPRVEDRERLVRLSFGPRLTLRENAGRDWSWPMSLRAPLPALERRANIFLQVDTLADSLADRGGARRCTRSRAPP